MVNILVVEDDIKLNQIVCSYLNDHEYNASGCTTAIDALDKLSFGGVDLVISDIMMPKMDGFDFAKQIRTLNKNIPILFMSARDDISAKQKGYKVGIDDYMVKPIDLEELLLRIAALLRRANIANQKKLTVGNVVLDANETTAYVNGSEVALTVKEFNILFKMLSHPKRTFTRNQLMDEFWNLDSDSTQRSVDVYINKLREKFAHTTDFEIATVHGLGYKVIIKT